MVKRIHCRVVHSVGLNSSSACADYAEPSDPGPAYRQTTDPTCSKPVERDIEKILSLIYNIKCAWLRKKLSNRNARPGLIIDFVA